MSRINFITYPLLCASSIFSSVNTDLDTNLLNETVFDQEITVQGTWRGSSVCIERTSGCHDEDVIYHISQQAGSDNLNVNADKIVDGKTINMGSLVFMPDREKGTISSRMGRNEWQFTIKGNQMDGILLRDGVKFRTAKLTKD